MEGQCGCVQVEALALAGVPAKSSGRRLWQRVTRWYQLGQERHALAALSDAALKDLGLSRADIHQETERPFWDDPLKK